MRSYVPTMKEKLIILVSLYILRYIPFLFCRPGLIQGISMQKQEKCCVRLQFLYTRLSCELEADKMLLSQSQAHLHFGYLALIEWNTFVFTSIVQGEFYELLSKRLLETKIYHNFWLYRFNDRLCGLVVRVLGRFPALQGKKSCESGTGSTQPREYEWGATW
jgi:hypothetical protein